MYSRLQCPSHSPDAGERGFSLTEMLVVIGLAGLILTLTVGPMLGAYHRQQARGVTRQARSLVRLAHIKALKEKVPHRVVFHDASASMSNTIELQRKQGGSFVTLSGHVYTAPHGVEILGSGSTDSIDAVEAGTRGSCDAGKIYTRGLDQRIRTVVIDPSCHTREL